MLAPAQVLPNSVGATAPYDNAGTLRTRGWELNLDWHHKFGEFNVYANFNLSDSKTKVTKWNNDTKLLSSYFRARLMVTFGASKQIVILKNQTLQVRMQMVHGSISQALPASPHLNGLRSTMVLVILSSKIWMAVVRLTVERNS